MGTTTVYGLPYPENTDRVTDGWDAIRDLAEATDDAIAELHPGVLGYVAKSSSEAGFGAAVIDIADLSVAVDVPAGHWIRITANVPSCVVTNAGETFALYIREGGTQLQVAAVTVPNPAAGGSLTAVVILAPSAGAHTYKASFQRAAGSGSATVAVAAGTVPFLLVEDIGKP